MHYWFKNGSDLKSGTEEWFVVALADMFLVDIAADCGGQTVAKRGVKSHTECWKTADLFPKRPERKDKLLKCLWQITSRLL